MLKTLQTISLVAIASLLFGSGDKSFAAGRIVVMKEIKLTQGKTAMVDDSDYESLNQFKWHARKDKDNFYAGRMPLRKGNTKANIILMHRQIIGVSAPNIKIDHADRNGLNNQRANLRIASNSQNNGNSKKYKHALSSKYKGVTFVTYKRPSKNHSYWVAKIGGGKNRKCLGLFKNEIDAATAYNRAAIEMFGEFANLNIIT